MLKEATDLLLFLAPSYFPRQLPTKYRHRSGVSQLRRGMESVWFHRAKSTRKAGGGKGKGVVVAYFQVPFTFFTKP